MTVFFFVIDRTVHKPSRALRIFDKNLDGLHKYCARGPNLCAQKIFFDERDFDLYQQNVFAYNSKITSLSIIL